MHKELKEKYNAQLTEIHKRIVTLLGSSEFWVIVEHQGQICIKITEEVLRVNEQGTRKLKLDTIIDAMHYSPVSYRGIDLDGATFSVAKGNDMSEQIERIYSELVIRDNQGLMDLPKVEDQFSDDDALAKIYEQERENREKVAKENQEAEDKRIKELQDAENNQA